MGLETFRLYVISDSGHRAFSGVIVLCSVDGSMVQYRWAGESTIRTLRACEWDKLDIEPSDFLEPLEPK